MAVILRNKAEIALMRRSGQLAQRLLLTLGDMAKAGVTPRDLDKFARRFLEENNARSPFLGKRSHNGVPFPATITVSVNEAIVHGIPTDKAFNSGDIVSLDVGTLLNGWMGDTAGTYPVGDISPRAARLLRVTEEALMLGIKEARIGNTVGDIGYAIQTHVETHGYSVVKGLVGHGVGRTLWEDPQIPNYGQRGKGVKLRAGMTVAIEPMVNEGSDDIKQIADKWTYVTKDGSLSAHFEHTIAILSDGPEILTKV
ncbi:MAG TPA: type I methionyl aminopeptidase [Abditibacteriaceae bacterium]|jgi:methionyl aminopeptidase